MILFLSLFINVALAANEWKEKGESYWAAHLTAEQLKICRHKGDEAPFTGKYDRLTKQGTYRCACCGESLFSSDKKFESPLGFASFSDAIDKSRIETTTTRRFGISRTEVSCSRCGAHLGYLFGDGPAPSFRRFRINSVCLDFTEEP